MLRALGSSLPLRMQPPCTTGFSEEVGQRAREREREGEREEREREKGRCSTGWARRPAGNQGPRTKASWRRACGRGVDLRKRRAAGIYHPVRLGQGGETATSSSRSISEQKSEREGIHGSVRFPSRTGDRS